MSLMENQKLGGNTLLIVLLVALAFFSGYFFFKAKSLEQINAGTTTQGTKPAQDQQGLNYEKLAAVSDNDHVLGSKDASIILVEYSDLECPFCKTFHQTMQQVLKDYMGKVAWVYRHYPLSFHKNAQKEAEAAECAGDLGGNQAFWKYIDTIYERTTSNGTGFALEKLVSLAGEIGLDQTKFKQCLDSGKYAQKVTDQMNGGAESGVQGTPGTFVLTNSGKHDFINGALPYDQVKAKIDSLLK